MIEWVESIDERILTLFTKFSHWFQWLTGRTNYFLAKVLVRLIFLGLMLEIVNYWFPILDEHTDTFDLVMDVLFCLLWVVPGIYLLDKLDRDSCEHGDVRPTAHLILQSSINWFMRPLIGFSSFTVAPVHLYNILVATRGFWLFSLCRHLFGLEFFCLLYFVAVNPLPPGISKVQEWKTAFQAGFQKLQPAHSTG